MSSEPANFRMLAFQKLQAGGYYTDATVICRFPPGDDSLPITVVTISDRGATYLEVSFTNWSNQRCRLTIPIESVVFNLIDEDTVYIDNVAQYEFRGNTFSIALPPDDCFKRIDVHSSTFASTGIEEHPPRVVSTQPIDLLDVTKYHLILRGCLQSTEAQLVFFRTMAAIGAMITQGLLDRSTGLGPVARVQEAQNEEQAMPNGLHNGRGHRSSPPDRGRGRSGYRGRRSTYRRGREPRDAYRSRFDERDEDSMDIDEGSSRGFEVPNNREIYRSSRRRSRSPSTRGRFQDRVERDTESHRREDRREGISRGRRRRKEKPDTSSRELVVPYVSPRIDASDKTPSTGRRICSSLADQRDAYIESGFKGYYQTAVEAGSNPSPSPPHEQPSFDSWFDEFDPEKTGEDSIHPDRQRLTQPKPLSERLSLAETEEHKLSRQESRGYRTRREENNSHYSPRTPRSVSRPYNNYGASRTNSDSTFKSRPVRGSGGDRHGQSGSFRTWI